MLPDERQDFVGIAVIGIPTCTYTTSGLSVLMLPRHTALLAACALLAEYVL